MTMTGSHTLRLIAIAATVVASSVFSAHATPNAQGDASVTTAQIGDSTAVLLAAGDIAACTNGSWETARLLDSLQGLIIVAGDAAYTSQQNPNPYRTCYDPTWGRHKERTRPVLGNHDAEPGVIRRYFEYFGKSAGPRPAGYYSFDVGGWHVLALNSTIAMRPRSAQGKWIAADLAAHPRLCTLAFMHHPRFSSGPHSNQQSAIDVFPTLDDAGVDVVVGAHDHIYERFAPMRANGSRDDRGVRQFVVGTGGSGLYPIERVQPNSEAQNNTDYGILKLTLNPSSYSWEFIPITQTGFRDSGSANCH